MSHADAVRAYWEAAEARDWERFASVLAADVVYTMEQTRERIRGRENYVRFNQEYPGDWHLVLERLVADEQGAFSWCRFTVAEETTSGLSVFTFDASGLIAAVDDFWPEAYDAPAGREHLTERS